MNIGLQWAYQELDINPLVGSITANILGAGLEAILNHQNMFVNIGEHLKEGVLNILPIDNSTDPWMHAAYISQVLDFAKLVKEQGILSALETYATAVFHQQTINMIVQDGGIIDMVTGRAELIIDPVTGREKKRLWTTYAKEYYVDIDTETGYIIEKFEQHNGKEYLIKQKYIVGADGSLILDGRIVHETDEDGILRETEFNKDGKILHIIQKSNNQLIKEILPKTGQKFVKIEGEKIINGILKNYEDGSEIVYEEGNVKSVLRFFLHRNKIFSTL